jgi:hypothetical protein
MAVETREDELGPRGGRGEAPGRSAGKPYGGRCSGCGSVYVGASIMLLYSDETGRYCRCGGRLREEVVEHPVGRRYRLLVPEELRAIGTDLHHRIERSGERARVEIVEGDRLVTLVVDENRVAGLLEDGRLGEPGYGGADFAPKNRNKEEASKEMTMFSGLETPSELNGLLDELYSGGPDGSRPDEARGGGRHATRCEEEYPKEAQDRARAVGHQPSRIEVVTRQEYEGERKQVTLIASNREEDEMPEERYTGGSKKEQGLVDKALDKAREKGYVGESTVRKAREKGLIDKANEAVDKIRNRLARR